MSFRSTFLCGAAALAAFTLTGCGEKPRPVSPADKPVDVSALPDWVSDPTQGGKYALAAFGTSDKMKAGFAVTKDKALFNARQELGKTIGSKIQAVVKDWTREGGTITSAEDKTMAMTMFESIARGVTNADVNGATQRAMIQDGNGTVFVWVYIDPNATAQIEAAVKAKAKEEIRAHFTAVVEADKAFAELDKLVDEKMGNKDGK